MTDQPKPTPQWSIMCDEARGRPRCLIVDKDGNEVAAVNPYREDWNEVSELIARAPELQQRVDELQIECDGWRQEGVALRQMVRDYEPDKERMDAYRRDLEEIGKTIGCDHIDDGLQRCVESTLDDLESDNQRLRESLRECHDQLHKLVSVFVSDQDGAHKQTCDLMRTVRDQLGMSHTQEKP